MTQRIQASLGVELLLDVGLRRAVVTAHAVDIANDGGEWIRHRVVSLHHSPTPSEIDRDLRGAPASSGLFYVVGRAGSALSRIAAGDPRVSFAALDSGTVSFLGEVRSSREPSPEKSSSQRRTPWGRYGVIRILALSREPLTQVEIAQRARLTQAAVSQTMKHLSEQVVRSADGWRARDREELWDQFLASYPGAGGLSTYWLALDEPARQLERVRLAATDSFFVSGDLAADHYAPWRRPSRFVLYTPVMFALENSGFAEVRSEEASLELRIAADPSVGASAGHWSVGGAGALQPDAPTHFVDPLITAWDVGATPGSDVQEALHFLRTMSLRSAQWH